MSRRLIPLLLISVLVAFSAGSTSAAASASAATRTLRIGSAPRTPAGARTLGALAGNTVLKLTVALAPQDPQALAAYAVAVSEPGSGEYHDYLTVAQFAQRFGATPTAIDAVRSSLQADGLAPSVVSANGLSLTVATTATDAGRAFSTAFQRVSLRGGTTGYANTSAPALDASIAGDVQGVVGLDDLARPRPLDLNRGSGGARPDSVLTNATTGPSAVTPCATASTEATTADNAGSFTSNQIASAYSFGGLYADGDEGAGETIAVYELEGSFPTDVTAYESCFGATGTVSYDPVDGGGGTPDPADGDGLETALDTENLLGLAPKANLIVYQAPNTTQGGLADYEAIISQDTAKVLTTSWGECEPDLGKSTADAENILFEEAAAQGQTIVAAAGDDGVQDCDGDSTTPNTTVAVDDPSSQPFVTGVGGTSLASGSPRTETVWNDPTTPANSLNPGFSGAGGGGDSSFWTMPVYQSSAPASLNVINAESSSSSCGASASTTATATATVSAGTDCREVPDVSADADPATGYLIYYDGDGSDTDPGAWISVGGTSGAAPVWAALFALADESSACTAPIGFANPDLYAAAGSDYAADFNDITSGDNDWLGTNNGEYAAGIGYDQTSGLGTPIASSLAASLCSEPTLTVSTPASQSTTVGTAASLRLTASESSGVTWIAAGLPAGLSLNGASGLISGTPTTAGSDAVVIEASDGDGRVASGRFSWTITPSTITLRATAAQHGQLGRATSLQLHATNSATAAPTYVAFGLPPGLKLASASGLISGTPRAHGIYKVTVAGTASNATPTSHDFTWSIGARPGLTRRSLGELGTPQAALSFRVSSGADAPELKTITLRLPSGLSFARRGAALTRLISVRSPSGSKLRFTASRSGGRLTITLRSSAKAAQVSLSAPGISASGQLTREARAHRAARRSLAVTVRDASGLTTALSTSVKPS